MALYSEKGGRHCKNENKQTKKLFAAIKIHSLYIKDVNIYGPEKWGECES